MLGVVNIWSGGIAEDIVPISVSFSPLSSATYTLYGGVPTKDVKINLVTSSKLYRKVSLILYG